MTTPEHAFQELVGVFSSRGNKVLEFEIIPPSLGSPFLQDGCSIGITKKALVQAFTVARQLFIGRLMSASEDDLRPNPLEREPNPDRLSNMVVTEVMLLFDCEHLTACNWRKRRLLAAIAQCPNAADQASSAVHMLETELTLMTTYQCSPLHRHTKSPTLWSHRLWVLRQLFRIQCWSSDALLKLQRAELDIVLRAGELHPKNYYAFSYIRQLHALLANTFSDVKDRPTGTVELARILVNPVLDWCLAHPRDISGWIFGKYLLDQIPDQRARADVIGRVLRFARDVGWDGESLWTFIDQAVRHYNLESVVDDILHHDKELPAPEVDQHVRQKWPWRTRLAQARAYWAVYGRSHDVQ